MLDFPDDPDDGDIWGRYQWDGVKWTFAPAMPAEPPVGLIADWPTDTAPTGWLILDGHAEERRRYPKLFAMIGTLFGAPTPRTFSLPDLRGQMLVGLDPDDTGRITILDVAEIWEEGGTELVGEHAHGVSGGTHGHTMNDPSHAHGVSQSGHVHGWADAWHSHGHNQDPHSHGLADPSHTHGKPDPGHAHTQGHSWDLRNALVQYAWYNFVTGGNEAVHWGGTGVWNDASGAGVNVHGANSDIYVAGAYSGLGCHGAVANLDVYGAYTGITVVNAGTGLTTTAANDGVGGNVQPVLELAKIVCAE